MPATYRLGSARRLVNRLVRALLRMGLGPRRTYLLTVQGRRSGRLRSTPVTLVEGGGRRWLVAPYGEVGWVRNARAAGRVTLSRGRRSETVAVAEVGPEESVLVLRRYVAEVPITRPFFDAAPDADLEAFKGEAPRHPVFRILGPAA
ncbi:MAG: nitroreductase family deazaflavin-dependent oxidoreductase [Candidatus Rokubacteria bacterium]|nr:nitroreductase family deazaflavin-dependent oxidoreductase [Candidatus Rokubacteria bacterium]